MVGAVVSLDLRLPTREQLSASVPGVVATMRRYLDQLASILRPGSVGGADLALRSLAAFLVENAPDVTGSDRATAGIWRTSGAG